MYLLGDSWPTAKKGNLRIDYVCPEQIEGCVQQTCSATRDVRKRLHFTASEHLES